MTIPPDILYTPEYKPIPIISPIRVRTAADLMTDVPPEQPWVVEPILGAGQVLLIAGPPKIGKSFLALDLLLSIVSGKDFLIHRVEKTNAIYFSAEGSEPLLMKRLDVAYKYRPDLTYYDFKNLGTCCTEGKMKLDTVSGEEALRRFAEKYDVVVIDPLYRFQSRGDENSHADQRRMQDVFDRLKTQGKALVLVHHTRKPGMTDSGIAEVRGAGWGEYADTVIRLSPRKENAVLAYVTRHAEEPEELLLERNGPFWGISGRAMSPEAVASFIREKDGRVEGRQPIIEHFKDRAKMRTVVEAISKAEKLNYIRSERKPGRGQGKVYISCKSNSCTEECTN